MARSFVRFSVLAIFSAGSLVNGANCYRAEVDVGPLLGEPSPSGGVGEMRGTGRAGSYEAFGGGPDGGADGQAGGGADGQAGGEVSGAGGAVSGGGGGPAAAPTCDPTPEDPLQKPCQESEPSKQACNEQAIDGWNGCYAGGCAICTQTLIDYPYYFHRHRCCEPNNTCSTHEPYPCSPLCPPPTDLDKRPLCFNLER